MAVVFDSLGYSEALRAADMSEAQARALANAARDFIMPEIATKADIAEIKHLIEKQGLQITVRLGSLGIVLTGLLFAALRLT